MQTVQLGVHHAAHRATPAVARFDCHGRDSGEGHGPGARQRHVPREDAGRADQLVTVEGAVHPGRVELVAQPLGVRVVELLQERCEEQVQDVVELILGHVTYGQL
jgi:hypothetical protein